MRSYVDILDERESLRGPFLESVVLHLAVAGLLVLSGISYQHSREVWGSANTQAGDVVPVTAVKTIPLPSRAGIVNPVANDTESQVPQAPKPEPKSSGFPKLHLPGFMKSKTEKKAETTVKDSQPAAPKAQPAPAKTTPSTSPASGPRGR